ncbi:hypothetical protein HRR83_000240 [Exophiala dermatitidis]|uniref:Copper acquisition factor BIM1-like domain-containing protein n=2 Tax=Exophiala dermatitidis TaxID=5970 RepID=H6C8Q5_EXODN|nr:uncharacterized protein HMPREF1120_08442 [Exophiala dermatitidis NIH/UT8656]KAJ4523593.1 hypothetical protein HRR73_002776 [Exophiala dermatitidis]EHY60482.1 hypothetical protein HMPREF1120_08442 [Exophiala dermatitidis NIH/UT8656]KAJ4524625.1 hypothetical protein HRR75_000215 [Exophiala dermatitidis]KAJ4527487.1 hypothetical protein HRR74_000241 [Exophiala dermatitidis]KAJ4531057.1 hypothetical protein HRR76_008738 [Exophiala dermatitidis]
MRSTSVFYALLSLLSLVSAHTVITYPGWRGDNLHSNGTAVDTHGLGTYGDKDQYLFPYGMQWMYPCGGMPTSTNRTKWPVKGGAVAFQPGWFPGHGTAFIYINLGLGTVPANMSLVMVNGIQIIGPTKDPYPGTFCLPQVPLPANISVNVGDNATIQLIETAVHGAALYNCVDITFADPEDVPEVNASNCFNSSQITSDLIFTTTSLKEDESSSSGLGFESSRYVYLSTALAVLAGLMWL